MVYNKISQNAIVSYVNGTAEQEINASVWKKKMANARRKYSWQGKYSTPGISWQDKYILIYFTSSPYKFKIS